MNLVCHKRAEIFLSSVRKQQKIDEKLKRLSIKKSIKKSQKVLIQQTTH